ncbi:MAG: hypothetical protein ACE5JN_01460 [Candidatus Methylomirabilia bacterium]
MPWYAPLTETNPRGVFGVNVGHLWHHVALLRRMLEEILRLVADGTLDPAEAHAYIQARRNFGKVLLVP